MLDPLCRQVGGLAVWREGRAPTHVSCPFVSSATAPQRPLLPESQWSPRIRSISVGKNGPALTASHLYPVALGCRQKGWVSRPVGRAERTPGTMGQMNGLCC